MQNKTKIMRGLYKVGMLYVVRTERYGSDRVLDWVAVLDLSEAKRIAHGGKLGEIEWVGNRLKDFDPKRI